MMSYWKRVDERLIKRGMLIMDLDFVRGYRDELVRMNRRERGRPYRIAESYVMLSDISSPSVTASLRVSPDPLRGSSRFFP
jgi:hypothetical protein